MTEPFNAASYLTERRVEAGDGDRVAIMHTRPDSTPTPSSPPRSGGSPAGWSRSGCARRSGC